MKPRKRDDLNREELQIQFMSHEHKRLRKERKSTYWIATLRSSQMWT
jgi:hypothetical protein